jgi:hypothetical protein
LAYTRKGEEWLQPFLPGCPLPILQQVVVGRNDKHAEDKNHQQEGDCSTLAAARRRRNHLWSSAPLPFPTARSHA